jgi:2'-5' RNA ligase
VADSPGTLRLFFALRPEAAQGAALLEHVGPSITRLAAQPVRAENVHATLCFLGSVGAGDLARLKSVAAAQHFAPASLRFDSLEYWQKPRVLCATLGESAVPAPMRELAASLALAARAAGFHPDEKPFRPHLTLARKVDAPHAAACEWPQPLVPPVVVRCDRFVLMESRRGESGSIYSVVDSWPLYAHDTDLGSANIQ